MITILLAAQVRDIVNPFPEGVLEISFTVMLVTTCKPINDYRNSSRPMWNPKS